MTDWWDHYMKKRREAEDKLAAEVICRECLLDDQKLRVTTMVGRKDWVQYTRICEHGIRSESMFFKIKMG